MSTLRLVLGDQLTPSLSSLTDLADGDAVVMAEVRAEATYVRHHKKKIAFIFAAMRHFAERLRERGADVRYFRYEGGNRGPQSLLGAVRHVLEDSKRPFGRLVVTEPGEWRLRQEMAGWSDELGVPVEVREDDRFLCSHVEFREWAEGRSNLLMETFYRRMRRKTGLLIQADGAPCGGRWNFDAENRKRLPKSYQPPRRIAFRPDEITQGAIDDVAHWFGDHFGELAPFDFAVTREEALRALNRFIADALPGFGAYQDAMTADDAFLNHAVLSAYINAGLLGPLEVCRKAEDAYRAGAAPLNAVEGFIRQIIGWREYVRGVYWLKMPDYAETNFLDARNPLPDFYWRPEKTRMRCVREAVRQTQVHAYSHHIQRLMVTGNFALLAGVAPKAIEEWYLIVYADAYDWVELPNTHGMAIFADGGVLGTKPYAASGAYINRMSDFCGGCAYDVKAKNGETACPFNYLYWDFLMRNRSKLGDLQRLRMPYRTLDGFSDAKRKAVREDSRNFLASIGLERP